MRCWNQECLDHYYTTDECSHGESMAGCPHRISNPPEGPDARRVSGASDCSDPRSGADNRAALAAKRPIPPRVAGRNPKVEIREAK